jgi:hypothetical protein
VSNSATHYDIYYKISHRWRNVTHNIKENGGTIVQDLSDPRITHVIIGATDTSRSATFELLHYIVFINHMIEPEILSNRRLGRQSIHRTALLTDTQLL